MIRQRSTILAVIVCLMVTLLAGCGKKPEETVNAFLTALKSGHYTAAQMLTTSGMASLRGAVKGDPGLIKTLLERMSYKVLEPNVAGDTAQVEVEFTAVDLMLIVEETTSELIALLPGELEDATDEVVKDRFASTMMGKVKDPAAKMITTKVTLELEKAGSGWKVAVDADNETALVDAFTGGYLATVAKMSSDE